MSRETKLDRMSDAQKAAEAIKYWTAPDEAVFSQEVLAIVYERSIAWFQLKRCTGGGIPFSKREGTRAILYKKSDAIAYFGTRSVNSTSAYANAS